MTTLDHRFPCPACGSDLRFHPASGDLVCDHCGHAEPMERAPQAPSALAELDFETALRDALPRAEMEETRVAPCTSCGAEVEFDPDIHATECPFCASPIVTQTSVHRHIKPGAVMPFAVDEAAARAAMTDWLGRLWFAPNGLTAYARKGRRMQGIYVPYWTFDAATRSAYRGQRGTVYYTTRTVRRDGKTRTVRVAKVRWRSVSGRVARAFDDVLVLASTSLPEQHTRALEPWDLAQLVPYTADYLAGFRAEAYQVDLPDGFGLAKRKMDAQIARDVRFDIGGDRQRIDRIDTDVRDVTFKHVLLPVWLAAYTFRGQSYRFVVNGQTGRVQGERPWSVWKLALAGLAALLVALVAFYLYAAFGS